MSSIFHATQSQSAASGNPQLLGERKALPVWQRHGPISGALRPGAVFLRPDVLGAAAGTGRTAQGVSVAGTDAASALGEVSGNIFSAAHGDQQGASIVPPISFPRDQRAALSLSPTAMRGGVTQAPPDAAPANDSRGCGDLPVCMWCRPGYRVARDQSGTVCAACLEKLRWRTMAQLIVERFMEDAA